jgi:DEAD/DEAH box helicase domain-containing protein
VASFLHDQAAQVTQFARQRHLPLSGRLLAQDAVSQLLEYLRAPERGPWQHLAGIVGLATLMPLRPAVSMELLERTMQRLRSEAALPSLDIPDDAPAGDWRYSVVTRYGWPLYLLVTAAEAGLRGGSLPAALSVTWRLEDGQAQRSSEGFVKHWRQFWLLDNLLQFLPDYAAVSNEYIGQFVAQPDVPAQQPAAPVAFSGDPAWNEALRFADPSCASLLQACQTANLPAPTVGFELLSPTGVVVAQAELAWPEQRVAVLLPGEDESRALFADAGWQVFEAHQSDDVRAALTEG